MYFLIVLGDEKSSSPTGSIKTESSVSFDSLYPMNNDHERRQGEDATKAPSEEKAADIGAPTSLSPNEQISTHQASTAMQQVAKTEAQTVSSNAVEPGSPTDASDQTVRDYPVMAADSKVEEMDETIRHTPVASQFNPAISQDEESQLSFNQESQSGESSVFSVRWPKVHTELNATTIMHVRCILF